MNYPIDLDDVSDNTLLLEIRRRTGIAHMGLCAYCGRPCYLVPCKNTTQHLGTKPLLMAVGDVIKEYDRAREKHGDMTLDGSKMNDLGRLAALTEETGEVARCLTYDQDLGEIRKELIQVANVALTWATVVTEVPGNDH